MNSPRFRSLSFLVTKASVEISSAIILTMTSTIAGGRVLSKYMVRRPMKRSIDSSHNDDDNNNNNNNNNNNGDDDDNDQDRPPTATSTNNDQ